MKTFRFHRQQLLPIDIETVFAFFVAAANLELITPPWLRFEVLTPSPFMIEDGTLIDYRLRLHGVPLRWRSRIGGWEPPFRFTDTQVRGPYALWVHSHRFEATGGATLVRDDVIYAVHGGALANRLFVLPDLRKIFDYRRDQLELWALDLLREREPAL